MSRMSIKAGLTVGALAGAVLLAGCHGGSRQHTAPAPDASAPAAPATTAPATSPAVSPPAGVIKPATTILGTIFYSVSPDRYYRSNTTILRGAPLNAAEASPDGRQIAYVDHLQSDGTAGDLEVKTLTTGQVRKLHSHIASFIFNPSWSPDGTRLVTAISTGPDRWQAGTVRVSDGAFTPLPKPLQNGTNFRFSGDGKQFFFIRGECVVYHAGVDGTGIKRVPRLGDRNSGVNPGFVRACDIVSVNRDGSRITVDLKAGDAANGDTGDITADTVIDTATGRAVSLPVRGKVIGVYYRPDGTLLVRTLAAGSRTLTLLSPAGDILARAAEPGWAKAMDLHDYTR